MYIDRTDTKNILRDFWTLDQLLELVRVENHPTDSDWRYLSSKRDRASREWDFHLGYDRAVEMVVTGWQEKAQELENLADRMSADYEAQGHTWVFSDSGDDIDVSRFLDGEPDHWIEHRPTEAREITVKVDLSYNANVGASQAFKRGAAVYAVVRALEKAGVSVAVVGLLSSESNFGSNNYYYNEIELKKAKEYIDPSRLAYFLAHPAFFRRLGFRLKECYGKENNVFTSVTANYGHSYNVLELIPDEPNQVVIREMRSYQRQWDNEQSAIAAIVKEFSDQGVQINRLD